MSLLRLRAVLQQGVHAPELKPGYMLNDQFAVPIISDLKTPTDTGRPWPPYSRGNDSPCQPPATNCA